MSDDNDDRGIITQRYQDAIAEHLSITVDDAQTHIAELRAQIAAQDAVLESEKKLRGEMKTTILEQAKEIRNLSTINEGLHTQVTELHTIREYMNELRAMHRAFRTLIDAVAAAKPEDLTKLVDLAKKLDPQLKRLGVR